MIKQPVRFVGAHGEARDIHGQVWIEAAEERDTRARKHLVLCLHLWSKRRGLVTLDGVLALQPGAVEGHWATTNTREWPLNSTSIELVKWLGSEPIRQGFQIHNPKKFPPPRIEGTLTLTRPASGVSEILKATINIEAK